MSPDPFPRPYRRGLRIARAYDGEGRLTPEFLTNLNRGLHRYAGRRRRGSVLIDIAVGLLFALAAGL